MTAIAIRVWGSLPVPYLLVPMLSHSWDALQFLPLSFPFPPCRFLFQPIPFYSLPFPTNGLRHGEGRERIRDRIRNPWETHGFTINMHLRDPTTATHGFSQAVFLYALKKYGTINPIAGTFLLLWEMECGREWGGEDHFWRINIRFRGTRGVSDDGNNN